MIIFFNSLRYRFSGYDIFHLHWLFPFAPKKRSNLNYLLNTLYVPLFLIWIKVLGYKIIWTVHNYQPHERTTLNDRALMKLVALLCTKAIAHNPISEERLKLLNLRANKVEIIGHGHYIDSYPNTISKAEARKALGFKGSQFVILFFGHLKPYKGIEDLVHVFQKIPNPQKKYQLLIAGVGNNDSYTKSLHQICKSNKNIHCYFSYIEDKDVQTFFNASDIAVFPFKKITTSGSLLLAASFRLASIAPKMGAITHLPKDIGYFYEKASNDQSALEELSKQINFAFSNPTEMITRGENAFRFVKKNSWDEIAKKTIKTYQLS